MNERNYVRRTIDSMSDEELEELIYTSFLYWARRRAMEQKR